MVIVSIIRSIRDYKQGSIDGKWSLSPQRVRKRVQFLVKRWREPRQGEKRGWLVLYWQPIVWLRQATLLVVAEVASTVIKEIDPVLYPAQRTLAVWVQVSLVIVIQLVALRWNTIMRPYEHAFQNTLESWLLGSSALIVALAGVYDELVRCAARATTRPAPERMHSSACATSTSS